MSTKSRAEELLELRASQPPMIHPAMVKGASDVRRKSLEEETRRGLYRDGSGNGRMYGDDKITPAGKIEYTSLNKRANFSSATSLAPGGASWRGSNDTVRQVPEIYSPLWLNSNLSLPRDRATVNAWSRSFFALNPIVQNAITLHATYPISKLNIKCSNPEVEEFFATMIEELDLMSVCSQIAQEYWTLGEAIVYGELGDNGKWTRLILQNPDYITIERSPVAGEPVISLRPDENLRRLVTSHRPADVQQRNQLDPHIIEHVRRGENIPLNNFYVSHLARKISPYEIRGTGLIVSCFRQLMLFDRLYESKYVQADSMINPLTLVKIGSPEFRPNAVDLEQWRNVFEAAESDKHFKIFTHNEIEVERVGYGQGIYDISNDLERLIKLIYIGLMVPSVLMDGSDTTYATGSIALDVLRQRYMNFRQILGDWLRNKIFAPISHLNDFYEVRNGKKVLIVPEIDWNHMSLFDMSDYIQNLLNLAGTGDPAQKRVSTQTLYRSLGLEYDEEMRKIRYEDIRETIRRKELASLEQHSLSELRSLKAGDEIEEILPAANENESPYDEPPVPGQPGAPPMGGGMGLPPIGVPQAPIGAKGPSKPTATPPPPGNVGIGAGGIPKPPPPV